VLLGEANQRGLPGTLPVWGEEEQGLGLGFEQGLGLGFRVLVKSMSVDCRAPCQFGRRRRV
jgi:hypothetical protein